MSIRKQILSYSSINIVNAAVPFLLLPILTRYLNPDDYGLLSLIQLLMLISLPILLMNTQGLLMVEYSKLSHEEFKSLLSTVIQVPVVGFLILEILFFIFEKYIIEYFKIPQSYIFLIPFFVLFQAIPTIVPIVFQAKEEPINFGKYKISLTILNIAFSLLFVVTLNYGWEGRLWGIVFSYFVFFIIGMIILYKLDLLKIIFSKKLLLEVFHFGLPLIPHSIAGVFLAMSDRIFLVNMLNEHAVGIYSVAYQISTVVLIIMRSINQAWAPHLYKILNNNPSLEDKKNIVKITYTIMGSMVIFTIMFIFISPFIFNYFIEKTYYEGINITKIISIAFLFQGFYFMFTNYIFYVKKTKYLSYITLFSVVVLFILNYIMIPSFGIIGSAYAMLIAWILQFVVVFYFSNNIYKMPWRLVV